MICRNCKIDKPEEDFAFRMDTGKRRTECKECKRKKDKEYYHSNKNEDYYKEKRKEYYNKNKSKLTKYKDLPRERKDIRNKRARDRRETDLSFRIITNLRASLSSRLKNNKKSKTFELLGCSSSKEVLHHLISTIEITEEEYFLNKAEFHIDHIIPLKLYDIEKESELKKAWNVRNLRLVSKEENLLKGDIFDKDLIKDYNIEDLLPEGFDLNENN